MLGGEVEGLQSDSECKHVHPLDKSRREADTISNSPLANDNVLHIYPNNYLLS